MRKLLLALMLVLAMVVVGQAQTTTTVQNGVGGYGSQVQDALSAGGWGWGSSPNPGYDSPGTGIWTGDDDVELVSSSFTPDDPGYPYYNMRSLIKFPGIESLVPAGDTVLSAQLILDNCGQHAAGSATPMKVSEALQPWVKGSTWWLNYGNGGTDAGWIGPVMDSVIHDPITNLPCPLSFSLDPVVVQNWVDNPSSNNGVMLYFDMGVYHSHFWSSNPALVIESIPEPATLTLLGLGGLALIRRKR